LSWSANFSCSIESIPATARLVTPAYSTGYAEDEQKAAFRIAVEAAVIAASVVGPPSAEVMVTVGGHANPNNEPEGGWAKDTITIAIARR